MIETYIVFFSRLHKLGLIHDLSDFFFKQTMREDTCATLAALLVRIHRLARATTHRRRLLA
jgi:hypothetical protein